MKFSRCIRTDFTTFALALTLAGLLTTLTGCEDATNPTDSAIAMAPGDERPTREASGTREAKDSNGLEAIRARADRAFEEMDDSSSSRSGQRTSRTTQTMRTTPTTPTTRTTSRIGPQPWPADLPTTWPRLESARVLADTQRDGDRLLLVDLPGEPDEAANEYSEALRSRGYAIDQTQTARIGQAIYAESPDHEAVLTFFPRDQITRLEILFLEKTAS